VNVAAEMATGNTNVFLLHARPGVDEEQYPDIMLALSKTEVFKRRTQTDRLFSLANAVLASRGIVSADQLVMEGDPAEIILRHASRLGTDLIVLAAESRNEPIARRVVDHAPCAVLLAKHSALTARRGPQCTRPRDLIPFEGGESWISS
jgi:nucleotide-binding universal stress UspA family protein